MPNEITQLVNKKLALPMVPVLRSIDKTNRTIEFVASTEAEDRYGDVIEVAGWKLDNYRKNPVFLFAHRADMPPVGRSDKVTQELGANPALVNLVRFAPKSTFPFAETIFQLYVGKFLNATSVGFMPLKNPTVRVDPKTDERLGYRFQKQELLELSGVPVPANPEALGRAIEKGLLSENEAEHLFTPFLKMRKSVYEIKGWFGDTNPPWQNDVPGVTYSLDKDSETDTVTVDAPTSSASAPATAVVAAVVGAPDKSTDGIAPDVLARFDEQGKQIMAISTTLDAAVTLFTDELGKQKDTFAAIDQRVTETLQSLDAKLSDTIKQILTPSPDTRTAEEVGKSVCPYKAEKLAPPDAPWDASAEMAKQTTPAGWKRMSTVIVGDPANKTSYKLPHHKGDGFAVVRRGVANALARLSQTSMPSTDKPGAKSHLTKHMAQFQDGFDEVQFCSRLDGLERHYQSELDAGSVEWAVRVFYAICQLCSADFSGEEIELSEAEQKLYGINAPAKFVVTKNESETICKFVSATREIRQMDDVAPHCDNLSKAEGMVEDVIAFCDGHANDAVKGLSGPLRGAETVMEKCVAKMKSLMSGEPAEDEPAGEPEQPGEPAEPSDTGDQPKHVMSFEEVLASIIGPPPKV